MSITNKLSSINHTYIVPFKKNPVVRFTSSVCVETIKITASASFLTLLAVKFTRPNTRISTNYIHSAIVVAPVVEEVLFRGICLRGIGLIQRMCSPKDKQIQKIFRIRLSALLFGLAHFTNPQRSIFQVCNCTIIGIGYGYLSEKYKSLSVSILAHGMHNFCAIKAITASSQKTPSPHKTGVFLALMIVNDIGVYVLATRNFGKTDKSVG